MTDTTSAVLTFDCQLQTSTVHAVAAPRRFELVRPYSLLLWFALPLLGFAWLWFLPPHSLDIAISKVFFSDGVWWGRTQWWVEPLLHQAPKYLSILIAICAAGKLARLWAKTSSSRVVREEARPEMLRLTYLLVSMLACVLAIYFLKTSTGISCPAKTVEFGGVNEIKSAASAFVLGSIPGNCWPSGAAGGGFCLFGLYFYFRDKSVKAARLAFGLVLLSGTIAGFGRMTDGMHFASHVLASFFVDWMLVASIYLLFFSRGHLIERFWIELKGRIADTTETGRLKPDRPFVSQTTCIIFTAIWWTLVYDSPMYARLVSLPEVLTWTKVSLFIGSAMAFGVLAVALLEMFSWLPAKVFRAVLVVLSAVGAVGFAGAYLYGIAYTPDMVRNFLATDTHEALGYLSPRTLSVFFCSWTPLLWISLSFVPMARARVSVADLFTRQMLWCAAKRVGLVAVLIASALGMVLLNFQAFSGAMRADKSLRYQIVPAIMVYSLVRTLTADASPDGLRVRLVIDPNPQRMVKPERPTLFVVVVGETTRSANWQLAGYNRETNPELAKRDILNFPLVQACGTSTDVSLPCMMSRIGRSDYNRDRILSEEALPDVLQRAGFNVLWVDNQSGCKGVCAGVPSRGPAEALKKSSAACADGKCFDGVLADEVQTALDGLSKGQSQVLFLHMMGSHGPAYHLRSPKDQKKWLPECTANDLGSCSEEELDNAYDNSVRYTDKVLADIIDTLKGASGMNTAMLYVSDHGESLGEKGLYLHGAPYWMSPDEQVQVPMVMWMSDNFAQDYKVDREKLAATAKNKVTHESLYHTVLGLLQVSSTTKADRFDLTKR